MIVIKYILWHAKYCNYMYSYLLPLFNCKCPQKEADLSKEAVFI